MKKIKIERISDLRDIRLERERLRYMALRTEMELSKDFNFIKKTLNFPNLADMTWFYLGDYLKRSILSFFK